MARPERNNVDYFPFLCDEGEKMFVIENKHGNDGFATFIKILRALASTDYHYLDLSSKTTLMYLSAKCFVSEEKLLAIIQDLVDLGKFDERLWGHKIIWCQDFIDTIQDAYKRRNNKCITYEGLCKHLSIKCIPKEGLSILKGSGNPQSKVKYSKVKKKESVCALKLIDTQSPPDGVDALHFFVAKSYHNLFLRKGKNKTLERAKLSGWINTTKKLLKVDRVPLKQLIAIKLYWSKCLDGERGTDMFWIETVNSINALRKIDRDGVYYYDKITPEIKKWYKARPEEEKKVIELEQNLMKKVHELAG